MLLVILIILLIILLILLGRWLFGTPAPLPPPAGPAMGISNVVVTITPGQLTAGSTQKFTVTVNAHGYSDTSTPRNVNLKLMEWDPV